MENQQTVSVDRAVDNERQQRRLDLILDSNHPIFQLTNFIPWGDLSREIGCTGYTGQPQHSLRMLLGIEYFKKTNNLTDSDVIILWGRKPYWQYFCGEVFFQSECPVSTDCLKEWRSDLRGIYRKNTQLSGFLEQLSLFGLDKAFTFLFEDDLEEGAAFQEVRLAAG